jgi:hypothetical protein
MRSPFVLGKKNAVKAKRLFFHFEGGEFIPPRFPLIFADYNEERVRKFTEEAIKE